MRIEHSVTSISWIPSTSMKGMGGVAIKVGVAHDDPPPPDVLGADVEAGLQELHRQRPAALRQPPAGGIEVGDDGTITGAEYLAGGRIGSTTLRVGTELTFAAVSMPDRQAEPEFGDGWVRFTQTAGGRTGVPMPRPVSRAPFVQYRAPLAWSTLELTIFADGHSEHRLTGASTFPRHWVYDTEGTLVAKTGLIDMKEWASNAFGKHTPWGDEDSPAFVTEVETALERELANLVMRGAARPKIRKVRDGRRAHPPGRARATSCTCCSTECSSSTSTARSGPRSVRAPCSASGRCSRAAAGPRRCSHARRAGSPPWPPSRSTATSWPSWRRTIAGRCPATPTTPPASSSSPDAGAPVRGPRLDPGAGRRVHSRWRSHVVRGDRPRR